MAFLPLRSVPIDGDAKDAYHRWLEGIDNELSRPDCDRRELCRRVLTDIHRPWGASASSWSQLFGADLNETERVLVLHMDPANGNRGARILRRHRSGAVCEGQAPAVDVGDVRPESTRGEPLPGRALSADPGPAHLPPLRPRLQGLPPSQVLVRLQHGGWRRRRGAPAHAARRSGRHPAGRRRLGLGLRQHLQPQPRCRELGRDHQPDDRGGRPACASRTTPPSSPGSPLPTTA